MVNSLPAPHPCLSPSFSLMLPILALVGFLLLSFAGPSEGIIEIKSLMIPERVENGTEDSVILDCIYTLDEKEDEKLVVKWFFNDDPVPIYQWIPELTTRTPSNRLQGRINLDFAVNTGSPYTKYRAINILRPTTDLSGRYSCHVASLRSQDTKEKTMLVYAPPKSFQFNFTRISKEEAKVMANGKSLRLNLQGMNREMMALSDHNELSPGALLKCNAEDVFPKPEMIMYRISSDGRRYRLLDVKRREQLSPNRAHDVEISAHIVDSELIRKYGKEPFIFECLMELDINGSNITKSSTIAYFPDETLINGSDKLRTGWLFTVGWICFGTSFLIFMLG